MSSNALAIREAIFTRLSTLQGYKKFRRVLTPQLQPSDLPCLSVSILSETMTPDGDENAGEPRFISDSVIAVSVARGFDDPIVLDGQMDADVDDIESNLLSDPTFVTFGSGSLFESVPQITRRRLYPFEGETYFSELRLELTFRSRVEFPPLIQPPFSGVTMTTRPLGNAQADPVLSNFPVTE